MTTDHSELSVRDNDHPQSLFANNQQYAEKELQNRVFGHSGHAPENPVRFLHRNGAHFIGGAVFKQHGVYHVIVFVKRHVYSSCIWQNRCHHLAPSE